MGQNCLFEEFFKINSESSGKMITDDCCGVTQAVLRLILKIPPK